MRRNNEDRLMGGHKPQKTEDAPQMANPMDFVTPSEFVPLPSKGRYPQGHPLHGQDSVEINYMTAKDEDILTSRSMLKKGIAIDRLIQNLIKDKTVDSKSLYIGDRNAIVIHARASAYGKDYKTSVQCPSCGETSKTVFDLGDHEVYHGDDWGDVKIETTKRGTYKVTLPLSKIQTELRPLLGRDEMALVSQSKKPKDMMEKIITKQMKRFVVSFNNYDDPQTINNVIDKMTASDSRYLRACFKLISPDITVKKNFQCPHCDHEEEMTVPFGADFFWPE